MARILGIGIATLDIINRLDAHAIDLAPVRRIPQGKVPTSYITLNQRNGSRSIVHYRDLPEYDFDAFATIDLRACDWLHFEGRNIDETARMLAHARRTQPHIPRSVEIEKPRAEIERLFADATLLLFSRAYVHARGGDEPAAFLRDMRLLARTSGPPGARQAPVRWAATAVSCKARPFRRRASSTPWAPATPSTPASSMRGCTERRLRTPSHRPASSQGRNAASKGSTFSAIPPRITPSPSQAPHPCSNSTTAAASPCSSASPATACAARRSPRPSSPTSI